MGDFDGGTHPLSPSKLRSPLLRRHGRTVATSSFERCYATWPALDQRYGERGREHVAEDNYWHLEHLDEAVATDDPQSFADYADWLVGLLEARGLERRHVAGAFGFLADALAAVACSSKQEAHRQALIDVLRTNQQRILEPEGVNSGRKSTPLS